MSDQETIERVLAGHLELARHVGVDLLPIFQAAANLALVASDGQTADRISWHPYMSPDNQLNTSSSA
jgi:hypothetical protein